MKKLLSILLAFLMCFSFCACEKKPDLETCVYNADSFIESYPLHSEDYIASGGYDAEENAYVVLMEINQQTLENALADTKAINQERYDLLKKVLIQIADNNTEVISIELSGLVSMVSVFFEGTDVSVVGEYRDSKGNITYAISSDETTE